MTEPVYRLTPDAVVWAVESDEVLALDLERGSFLGVNSSGTLLWSALGAGATRQQLASALQEQYGVDAERADADVDAFLEACDSRGFLAR